MHGGQSSQDRRLIAVGLRDWARSIDWGVRNDYLRSGSPGGAAEEVGATVQAFREVRAPGAADRFLPAVAPDSLDGAVQLVEAALAEGPDVDIGLVPSDAPTPLLQEPWLAVAPRGSRWHGGRAGAVWALDPVAALAPV